ncbi:MAG: hypothetical protein AAGG48_17695 [Planctomycetota bacterium]
MYDYLIITVISVSAFILLTVACHRIDRFLRRREQRAFLLGPLRDQLQYMMNSRPLRTAPVITLNVQSTQPIALLDDHRLSA